MVNLRVVPWLALIVWAPLADGAPKAAGGSGMLAPVEETYGYGGYRPAESEEMACLELDHPCGNEGSSSSRDHQVEPLPSSGWSTLSPCKTSCGHWPWLLAK